VVVILFIAVARAMVHFQRTRLLIDLYQGQEITIRAQGKPYSLRMAG
jgi:hypothetical protein